MGAKVQCENYFPLFYSNKNVQGDTRTKINFADAWPYCAKEIILKEGQSYSIFKQNTMEGYAEYDKEFLKQTMLKHEEIFRGQVRELHRLYKVQKLLMDDLKRKDLNTSTLSSAMTQDGPFLFHFGTEHLQSKGKGNLWDALNGCMTDNDSRGCRHLIPGTQCPQTPGSSLMEKSLQIGLTKDIKDGSKDFYRMQPSRAARRTFDLERPADEYMDDDSTDQIEEGTVQKIAINGNGKEQKSSGFHYNLEPESEVQLTLSTGWEKGAKEDGRQTGPHVDLGFPELKGEDIKESKRPRCNEEATLFSTACNRAAVPEEILGKQRSSASNQSFLGGLWGFGQECQKNENRRPEWQKFDVKHEESRKERQSLDIEAGPGANNSNTLIEGFTWQQPSVLYQPRQVEIDAVKRGCLVGHEARPIIFQDQRGTGHSWSKEGILTGIATQQQNSKFEISSIGSPVGIPPTPLTVSPLPFSQKHALWRKAEDSFCQFPLAVHSKIHPVITAPKDLQMQNYDPHSISQLPPPVDNGIDGINSRGCTSEFGSINWCLNGSSMQSGQNQLSSVFNSGSLSCLGQDLSQSASAFGTRSVQQQVAAYAMPASSLGLSGFPMNSLQERSKPLKSAHVNGLSPLQVPGSEKAEKDSQVSCFVDLREVKEVDLTLGLSNRVNEESSKKNAPGYFLVAEHPDGGHNQRSVSSTQGLVELPCIITTESNFAKMILPKSDMDSSGLVKKLLSATFPYKSACNDTHPVIDKLVDGGVPLSIREKLTFPLPSSLMWKDGDILHGENGMKPNVLQATEGEALQSGNLEKQDFNKQLLSISTVLQTSEDNVNFTLTGQTSRNKQIHLHGAMGLADCAMKMDTSKVSVDAAQDFQASDVHGPHKENGFSCDSKQTWIANSSLQAVEMILPVDKNLHEKTSEDNVNFTSTGQTSRNKQIHLHGAMGLADCAMKMDTSKVSVDAAQDFEASDVHGPHKENGFSCDSKQTWIANSSLQAVEMVLPVYKNLHEKTTEYPKFKGEGNGEEVSMQMEMEAIDATGHCKGSTERGLYYQEFDAKVELVTTKSSSHGGDIDKGAVKDRESLAHSSLQVPICDTRSAVKLLKDSSLKTCDTLDSGQENQDLIEALCHSGQEGMKMVRDDEIENGMCIEEVDSKLVNCTELLVETDESNVQICSKSTWNAAKNPSSCSQLPGIAYAISPASDNVSEVTHHAAETLLRIASKSKMEPFDVGTCQPPNSPGLKRSLKWFADMIPGDADCLKFALAGSREEMDNSLLSPDSDVVMKETDVCADATPRKGSYGSHSTSGVDFFEYMTLMLRESNVDEYCKPFVKEYNEVEKLSSPVNNVLRTSKRGKRQRDFQRETLPGISSLSRQEITEDLQIIGGLMRSAGDACPIGFTRRNAVAFSSRDDWFIAPRGRRSRYLGGSQACSDHVETSINLRQLSSYDQEIDRLNGIAWTTTWGETTRRRRMQRQRTPLSSLALNPT
eukprot:Gb_30023 [translate_table: standard]